MGRAYHETTPTRERICINGLWQWQPAETRGDRPPTGQLGLLQGAGVLAGNHRLHAEGLPDGLRPSELEGHEAGRRDGGLVPARDHRSRGVGRPPHRALRRVPELLRRGVRGREEGRRDALPRRRGGPHLGVPAGQQARAQHARRGHAAEGRHAVVQRHQRGQGGEGQRSRGAGCAATSTSSARPRPRASPT